MPISIQRLNYHTGLFLEQPEFRLEQRYYSSLRRRLNFAMFSPGIISGLEVQYDGLAASVTVKPGMAVDSDVTAFEGREMLISADQTVPLTGVVATDQVTIVLSYAEQLLAGDTKPPTTTPALTTEFANIDAVKTSAFVADPNLKIVLGEITVGTALAGPAPNRQLAQVRASLLPAPGAAPGISIPPTPVAAGTNGFLVHIAAIGGFSLLGVTKTDIEIAGNPGDFTPLAVANNLGTSLDFTFDVAPGAAPGTHVLTVKKSPNPTANLTVTPGLSVVSFTGIDESAFPSIDEVVFNGTGFAPGMSIEFTITGGALGAPLTVTGANGTVVGTTEIHIPKTVIAPNVITGPVRVTVGTQQFQSTFNFVPPPIVTGFTPGTVGPPFNVPVSISGSRLDTPTSRVAFNPYTTAATRGRGTAGFPIGGGVESVADGNITVAVPGTAVTRGFAAVMRVITGDTIAPGQTTGQLTPHTVLTTSLSIT